MQGRTKTAGLNSNATGVITPREKTTAMMSDFDLK